MRDILRRIHWNTRYNLRLRLFSLLRLRSNRRYAVEQMLREIPQVLAVVLVKPSGRLTDTASAVSPLLRALYSSVRISGQDFGPILWACILTGGSRARSGRAAGGNTAWIPGA